MFVTSSALTFVHAGGVQEAREDSRERGPGCAHAVRNRSHLCLQTAETAPGKVRRILKKRICDPKWLLGAAVQSHSEEGWFAKGETQRAKSAKGDRKMPTFPASSVEGAPAKEMSEENTLKGKREGKMAGRRRHCGERGRRRDCGFDRHPCKKKGDL